jgi:hypothetical protein
LRTRRPQLGRECGPPHRTHPTRPTSDHEMWSLRVHQPIVIPSSSTRIRCQRLRTSTTSGTCPCSQVTWPAVASEPTLATTSAPGTTARDAAILDTPGVQAHLMDRDELFGR